MIAAVLSIACSHLAAPSGAVAEAVTKKDFLLVAHRGVVTHGFSCEDMPLLTCSLVSHDSAILPSNQLKEAIVDGKHLTCRDRRRRQENSRT